MQKITIRDVAKSAGVSISTVSRVLNGRENVKEKVREAVNKAVEDVGYSPNALARSLRSQSTKTIGLIVNNILNPIYADIAQGAEDTARQYGFQLFLCNSGANKEQEAMYLNSLWEKKIEGLLIAPTGFNETRINDFFYANVPVVQVDRKSDNLQTDVVVTNNKKGAEQLVESIIERGYKNIAAIVGSPTVTTGVDRLSGYFSALSNYNMEAHFNHIKIGNFAESTGYEAMNELLKTDPLPDAVFAGNNFMAKGALKSIKEHNLSIPQDIGFAMFDNPDWSDMHNPPITCVQQPNYKVGIVAAELVFRRLKEQEKEWVPITETLENKIIIKDSV